MKCSLTKWKILLNVDVAKTVDLHYIYSALNMFYDLLLPPPEGCVLGVFVCLQNYTESNVWIFIKLSVWVGSSVEDGKPETYLQLRMMFIWLFDRKPVIRLRFVFFKPKPVSSHISLFYLKFTKILNYNKYFTVFYNILSIYHNFVLESLQKVPCGSYLYTS